jgi:O-antigen/teichoic acid export membrane protein
LKLREHLNTGIWAAADKGLLLIYGFAIILVVVAAIPDTEWGAFSMYQSIFLIISFVADSIFLQPMVKFASEHKAEIREALGASFILYVGSILLCGIVCLSMTNFLSRMLNSEELIQLLPWMPVLLLGHIFRNVGIRLLQVTYRIRAIFWIDAAFFGSIVILALVMRTNGTLHTAYDFMMINLAGGILSSIVAFFICRKQFIGMPILTVPREEYNKLLSFAKFQAGTSILQQLQQWSDNLIIGIYYSPKVVAVYAAAKTVYRLFDAVREGATLVIVPIASRLHSAGEHANLKSLTEKLLSLAFILLVPVSLIMMFASPMIMELIYKNKFPGIDIVFSILIASGIVLPLSLVATNVLIGIGRVKGLFLATLGGTIIFFVVNRILVPTLASEGAAIAVISSITAIGIFSYLSVKKEVPISFKGIISSFGSLRELLPKSK